MAALRSFYGITKLAGSSIFISFLVVGCAYHTDSSCGRGSHVRRVHASFFGMLGGLVQRRRMQEMS